MKKAVRDSLNTLFARYEEGFTIAKDWPSRDSDAGRMIHLLRAKSAGGKLDRSKIPGIIKQINDEINEEWRYKMKPELIKKLSNYFDSDEKLSIFIRYRAEPLFNTYHTPDEVKALKVLLDDGTLDNLVDQAAQWEKEYCSWDVTIGPAVKALRRLGSTSAGQDFNSLARYAKDHEKPLL